jgi:RNA polymerase sigma-70 factor (ECF subfamily)
MRMEKEAQFTEVVESYRERIYRICCCYVGDGETRKDVFQQVLINIWCSLDGFQSRARIGTWIYRIAINTCLGYLRSEKRRKRVFDDGSVVDLASVRDPADDEERNQREEDVRRLYDCVLRLEPVNRALISLYLEDVSIQEMADILGISEGNVRVKVHRVKSSLKAMMEGEGHGPR